MPAAIIAIFVLTIFYLWFGFTVPVKPQANNLLLSRSYDAPARILSKQPITIKAVSAVAFETDSRARIFNQNGDEVRSIASLTKLMSAIVFLNTKPGWNKEVVIEQGDLQTGSKANIFVGDRINLKDLFNASLIASDNTAMTALIRSTGLSEKEFVALMNQTAKDLRLGTMTFSDPTGLDINNQGTAVDVVRLAEQAFSYEAISSALKLPVYSFKVSPQLSRQVFSTNQLIGRKLPLGAKMLIGKTGHINEAGYCFTGIFEYRGKKIITAVLGAPLDENRFSETLRILDWTLKAYLWDNN